MVFQLNFQMYHLYEFNFESLELISNKVDMKQRIDSYNFLSLDLIFCYLILQCFPNAGNVIKNLIKEIAWYIILDLPSSQVVATWYHFINSKEVVFTFDNSLLHGLNNDCSSNSIPLFFILLLPL